jgi:hypothetical protein
MTAFFFLISGISVSELSEVVCDIRLEERPYTVLQESVVG